LRSLLLPHPSAKLSNRAIAATGAFTAGWDIWQLLHSKHWWGRCLQPVWHWRCWTCYHHRDHPRPTLLPLHPLCTLLSVHRLLLDWNGLCLPPVRPPAAQPYRRREQYSRGPLAAAKLTAGQPVWPAVSGQLGAVSRQLAATKRTAGQLVWQAVTCGQLAFTLLACWCG